jgi:hypothetical protein
VVVDAITWSWLALKLFALLSTIVKYTMQNTISIKLIIFFIPCENKVLK